MGTPAGPALRLAVPVERLTAAGLSTHRSATPLARVRTGLGENDGMTADNTADQAETPEEATKRKFREALEAKKGRKGEDHLDSGTGPVHPHGPIETKRVFRRKSGG